MTGMRQLLLVANEAELYGLDLACVQEIRVYQPMTRLPHAPAYVIGILNVSGQILPVIDLRYRLWGRKTDAGPWHVIVLVKQGDARCGILVDAANEIAEFAESEIDEMSSQTRSGCFAGIANFAGADGEAPERSIAILDIETIASFALEIFNPVAGHEEMDYA